MTVVELRAMCKKEGISGYSKLNKEALVKKCIVVKTKVIKPLGFGIPIKFYNIVQDCAQNAKWIKKNIIGKGKYGESYIACKTADDCDYILKQQKYTVDFDIEVQCLTELKGTGIVPEIYAAWRCKGKGYLVIEKLEKCSKSNKYKEIKQLLNNMDSIGWLHVDTHPGNIMCKDNKVLLIDFGWAVKKGKMSYPHHPFSKQMNVAFTYDDLKILQNYNLEKFFGDNDRALKEKSKLVTKYAIDFK